MAFLNETLRKIKSEELLSRFRSKEDLYKYMTLQRTRLSYLRAILSNEKKINVPFYEKLSVKNLYQDAMRDPFVSQYLPELEMNSNRMPERNLFFGVLGTIKNDYLQTVIKDVNMKRFSVEENQQNQNFISIDEHWYQELIKHPFISKKHGKAIFLMKQRSKLIRNKKVVHKFDISERISQPNGNELQELQQNFGIPQKRQKIKTLNISNVISNEDENSIMEYRI